MNDHRHLIYQSERDLDILPHVKVFSSLFFSSCSLLCPQPTIDVSCSLFHTSVTGHLSLWFTPLFYSNNSSGGLVISKWNSDTKSEENWGLSCLQASLTADIEVTFRQRVLYDVKLLNEERKEELFLYPIQIAVCRDSFSCDSAHCLKTKPNNFSSGH